MLTVKPWQSSNEPTTCSNKTLQLLSEKPDIEAFTATYSIAAQAMANKFVERALTSESSPVLGNIEEAYGERMAMKWVFLHLSHVLSMAGIKVDNASITQQLTMMANTILKHYAYMKASALMLFFDRFKAGYYGVFYGTFDPMRFMEALRTFDQWQRDEAWRIHQQRDQQRREEERQRRLDDPAVMTYDEYVALRDKAVATN